MHEIPEPNNTEPNDTDSKNTDPNNQIYPAQIGLNEIAEDRVEKRARVLNWSSFLFALLQSACTAVLTISGLRVAIGLGALASAAATTQPARHFHQDAIRIPMLALAVLGAGVNLYVLWHVRRLRNRPAAQWRLQPLTAAKKRSERLQFWLSIATLALVAAEWITHQLIHRSS